MSSPSSPSSPSPDDLLSLRGLLHTIFIVHPLIFFLELYDTHIAPHLRRTPDIHELARRAKGDVAVDAPIPLPRRRKRALSAPLPPLSRSSGMSYAVRRLRQQTDPQAGCIWWRLPLEIRQMVYREVLAGGADGTGRVVHMLRKEGRLGHWRCRIQGEVREGKAEGWEIYDRQGRRCLVQSRAGTGSKDDLGICDRAGQKCLEGWLAYKARVWSADWDGRLNIVTDGGMVGLLSTCRLIYTEAIPILYSQNTFHFYDPGAVLHFSRTITPTRLHTVTSMLLDWERPFSIFNPHNRIPSRDNREYRAWVAVWSIIAGMKSLRELRVFLKTHRFTVTKARRMKMCQPMMQVKGLKVFDVVVPWDGEVDLGYAGLELPFRVVRGPIKEVKEMMD